MCMVLEARQYDLIYFACMSARVRVCKSKRVCKSEFVDGQESEPK